MPPPTLPDDPQLRQQRSVTNRMALAAVAVCAIFAVILGVFMYHNAQRWNVLLPLELYQVGADGTVEHKPLEALRLRLVAAYQDFESLAADMDESETDQRLAEIEELRARYRSEHAAVVNEFLWRQSAMRVGAIMLLIALAGLVAAIIVAHRSWPAQPDPTQPPPDTIWLLELRQTRYAVLVTALVVIAGGWWLGRAVTDPLDDVAQEVAPEAQEAAVEDGAAADDE